MSNKEFWQHHDWGKDFENRMICPTCRNKKSECGEVCPTCNGTGEIFKEFI